jgi:hypothetical protein
MPFESNTGNVGSRSEADEQQPLLPSPQKLLPPDNLSTDSLTPEANLRVILPALMVCAFLAAFDVTVVAAIYPIMYTSTPFYS